ncbi:hypothetical protein D3C87_1528840 [compost metagenome]
MVLELKAPHGDSLADLLPLMPLFLSYILSFMYVAIYWSNHHHLFQLVKHVKGPILWANMHLLFWLSLIPFATAWSDENHFHSLPVATYGFVLLMCSIAYWILVRTLLREHGQDSDLAKAIGTDTKGKISTLIYLVSIPLAFVSAYLSLAMYVIVALIWIVPDIRVERVLKSE